MHVTGNFQKILEENRKIFNSWFESWLASRILKVMNQPKSFCSDRDVKICLFNKNNGSLAKTCQYGMIHEDEPSKYGLIRKVVMKYRNHNENVDQFTVRSVR